MSKSLRFSEKWFRRGLWLIAVVFANFLIGLGGLVVGDLPKVESPARIEDFIDARQAEAARATIRQQTQRLKEGEDARARAQLVFEAARNQTQGERDPDAGSGRVRDGHRRHPAERQRADHWRIADRDPSGRGARHRH